jgi:hypothetical protein
MSGVLLRYHHERRGCPVFPKEDISNRPAYERVSVHFVPFPNNPGYVEEGDFRITAYDQGLGRDEHNRRIRRKFNWWVNIEAVDGGIILTEEDWI